MSEPDHADSGTEVTSISLTESFLDRIDNAVRQGEYNSRSQFIREATKRLCREIENENLQKYESES